MLGVSHKRASVSEQVEKPRVIVPSVRIGSRAVILELAEAGTDVAQASFPVPSNGIIRRHDRLVKDCSECRMLVFEE